MYTRSRSYQHAWKHCRCRDELHPLAWLNLNRHALAIELDLDLLRPHCHRALP